MAPFEIGEAFVLFLVALSYVPVLRAYTIERESPWLVAGFTTLLLGRIAAVAETVVLPVVLNVVEHGVGIALTAAFFTLHFYGEWRTEESRYGGDQTSQSLLSGDR